MRTLKLTLHYLGARYQGWQLQPGRPTIQGELETALAALTGEPIRVVGAGRTDAGVHARGQVASLTLVSKIPPRGILLGTNDRLPADIRLMAVEEVAEGFHARHDARWKDYAYRFSTAPVISPFLAPVVTQVRSPLDRRRMEEAAECFLGEHDLAAFCGAEGRLKQTRRRITVSRLADEDEEVVAYWIRASGFLQHLVRTIAGTLIEVGRGRIDPEAIPGILVSRDRCRAGPTAPSGGLTLEQVAYDDAARILATPRGV
ncbi:MAG TPA: tRNA pseudouridine(38-40) synthase TruA [Candidatus Polarisedimenticolia bacterium]|nr:tRNA pseudouridine(38-40) synthase TruA [Candidatus Polarisedimenticolia bacterium]